MPCPGDPGPRPDFIPAPDCARLVMHYSIFGQSVNNIHYFWRNGGWDSGSLLEQAVEAAASWHTNIKPLLPTAATLVDITITDVAVEDSLQAITATSAPGTSGAAAFETTGNTFVIKFTTDHIGRSFRGRMYWPLLQVTQVNDGKLGSDALASVLVDAVSDFFADIESVTGNPHVIVSYQNDCEWRDVAVSTPVQGYTYTDLNLDSQRRRLPGRGT